MHYRICVYVNVSLKMLTFVVLDTNMEYMTI